MTPLEFLQNMFKIDMFQSRPEIFHGIMSMIPWLIAKLNEVITGVEGVLAGRDDLVLVVEGESTLRL